MMANFVKLGNTVPIMIFGTSSRKKNSKMIKQSSLWRLLNQFPVQSLVNTSEKQTYRKVLKMDFGKNVSKDKVWSHSF